MKKLMEMKNGLLLVFLGLLLAITLVLALPRLKKWMGEGNGQKNAQKTPEQSLVDSYSQSGSSFDGNAANSPNGAMSEKGADSLQALPPGENQSDAGSYSGSQLTLEQAISQSQAKIANLEKVLAAEKQYLAGLKKKIPYKQSQQTGGAIELSNGEPKVLPPNYPDLSKGNPYNFGKPNPKKKKSYKKAKKTKPAPPPQQLTASQKLDKILGKLGNLEKRIYKLEKKKK